MFNIIIHSVQGAPAGGKSRLVEKIVKSYLNSNPDKTVVFNMDKDIITHMTSPVIRSGLLPNTQDYVDARLPMWSAVSSMSKVLLDYRYINTLKLKNINTFVFIHQSTGMEAFLYDLAIDMSNTLDHYITSEFYNVAFYFDLAITTSGDINKKLMDKREIEGGIGAKSLSLDEINTMRMASLLNIQSLIDDLPFVTEHAEGYLGKIRATTNKLEEKMRRGYARVNVLSSAMVNGEEVYSTEVLETPIIRSTPYGSVEIVSHGKLATILG